MSTKSFKEFVENKEVTDAEVIEERRAPRAYKTSDEFERAADMIRDHLLNPMQDWAQETEDNISSSTNAVEKMENALDVFNEAIDAIYDAGA